MGIMLQRSKIAEDLLITMSQLFGPVPGGLWVSRLYLLALCSRRPPESLAQPWLRWGLSRWPVMLRNGYSQSLATGTIAASGTLGQIIPPSIVLIILADQLASAQLIKRVQPRKALHKAATGEISMPSEFAVTSTSAGEMFLGALVPWVGIGWPVHVVHINLRAYCVLQKHLLFVSMALTTSTFY